MNFETKIIRAKRKTVALQVLSDATVLVKVPLRFPLGQIEDFINNNIEWIQKKIAKRQLHPLSTTKRYQTGEQLLYGGNLYTLVIGNYPKITLEQERLLFPKFLEFRIHKELESWYIKQAKKFITDQTNYYADQMSTHYQDITFLDTKSRWGACTHDNRLQFNWRLIMAPLLVIRYVIIHELAHTIEKNHSVSFWSKVAYFSPSYKTQRKWLKLHGETLKI